MSLLPVEAALERLLAGAGPLDGQERVPLAEADGRVLAEDLVARLTQPPFDASAMDGYALRAEDLTGDATLTVIGESAAGRGFDGTVGPGETVRIFTGAPVPAGADTVLLQEDAERDGAQMRTTFIPARGRHIRPRGQDFAAGDRALSRGTVLDFASLTLAAAMNHAELPVLRRPKVALIATGDELVAPGTEPGPHQVVASNGAGVAALARRAGATVLDLGLVPDDKAQIAAALERARAAGADVIVTLGGASVGDHDLVQATLSEAGMQLDFWKIAMRPGKPLMVGRLGTTRVLGLPGNPVSSLVCALLFLEPLLIALSGLPPRHRIVTAIAGEDLAANDKRQDYLRARVSIEDGRLVATRFDRQDSSMMRIMAEAGGLIVRPPFAPPVPAGGSCSLLLFAPETLGGLSKRD